MKTPREILLASHQSAGPALDNLRQAIVADLNREAPAIGSHHPSGLIWSWLTAPWRELILPSRRIWSGLAAAWLLILGINVSQRDHVSSATGRPVYQPAVIVSLQVQQRWMSELLADRSTTVEADRPRNSTPRPRSEYGPVSLI